MVEVRLVRRKVRRLRAIRQDVPDANGYLVERRQDVQLRQGERREAVQSHRVTERDEVEPAAAPLAPRHRAELAAELTQPFLLFARDLAREGAGADARDVGLRDADDLVQPVR